MTSAVAKLVAKWRDAACSDECEHDHCVACRVHAKELEALATAPPEQACECDSSKGVLCDAHNPIMQGAERSLMQPQAYLEYSHVLAAAPEVNMTRDPRDKKESGEHRADSNQTSADPPQAVSGRWICPECHHPHLTTTVCTVITGAGACLCKNRYIVLEQERAASAGALDSISKIELFHLLFPEGTNAEFDTNDVPEMLDVYTHEVEQYTERKLAAHDQKVRAEVIEPAKITQDSTWRDGWRWTCQHGNESALHYTKMECGCELVVRAPAASKPEAAKETK